MISATVESKTGSFESTRIIASAPVSGGKWQVLDGRPVGIYRGVDDLVQVSRDAVVGLVVDAIDGCELWQKGQELVNQLGKTVADWITDKQEKIAGFIGAWRIQESDDADKTPTIRAIFVIAQSDQDEINEAFWLDIARLDVHIAGLPEFADVRASFIPVPFMTSDQLEAYLRIKCRD